MRATKAFDKFNIRIALRNNCRTLRRQIAKAWRRPTPPRVDEWMERSILIPAETEGTPGKVSFTKRPWWRQILRWATDPETRDLAIVAATQLGKTMNCDIALMIYIAEWMPAPAMIVVPDEGEAVNIRDRVYAIAKESCKVANFKRVRVPSRWKWNTRYIDLGSMRVYLAWSGSKQRMRGKPCWRVWMSEVDAYAPPDKKTGDAVEAGRQRVKSRSRFLRLYESSPGENPSRITAIEKASSARYRWHAACPHCGLMQEVKFFPHRTGELAGRGGIVGIKHKDKDEFVSLDDARAKAHYVCLGGCKIEQHEKDAFVENGDWYLEGAKGGDGAVEASQLSHREIGVHLWSVHSPSIGFGDIAAEFIRAKSENTVPDFWSNWLAISHEVKSKVPSWEVLGAKLAWTHERRTVPQDVWFLTAGADVQGDSNGVRYVIRGWAPDRTSWLIDWGWLERTPGDENQLVKSDMKKLEQAILADAFPVVGDEGVNPLGHSQLPVRLLNIDSNFLPFKVHHWIRSLPESWRDKETGRVRAVRGDHKISPDLRFRHSLVETNTRTGEKYDGGLDQWGIYVYPFYDELTEFLASDPGKPGAFYLTSDVTASGRSYLEQVTNFHRRTEFSSKDGRKKTLWKAKTDRIPVDFWDCEIYALVAANMVVGDMGWKREDWEAMRGNVAASQQQTSVRRSRRAEIDLSER